MFYGKGFASGLNVALSFSSADTAIEGSVIAVTVAAAKRGERNVEKQTFDTGKLLKQGLISEIGSGLIGAGWHQFALWIKVPLTNLSPAILSRRRSASRLPQKMAARRPATP